MARLTVALLAMTGVCLFGGGALALDPARSLSQFRHTAWTFRDGVPGEIRSIAQTSDGYLWLAATSGVYRFDGVRAQLVNPQSAAYGVFALAATGAGDLWMAGSGISRLGRDGRLTRFTVPELTPSAVRFVTIGPNGDVWVANSSQVARFNGRAWQIMQSDWGSAEGFKTPGGVWALAVDRDGVVWTKNVTGLYYLRPGAVRFAQAAGYGGGVVGFARAPDGRLWTADFASKRFYALPEIGLPGFPTRPAQVGAPVPRGLLGWIWIDRDGALWCANSVTNDLYRMRSVTGATQRAEVFTPRQGLTSDTPTAILEDREGDMWIGTDNGLDRFTPANVVPEPLTSFRGQRADITATDKAVYVASGWSVPVLKTHPEKVYRLAAGAASRALDIHVGDIQTLDATPAGAVLIGGERGLVRVEGDVATRIALPPQAEGSTVYSAAENGSDLWVSVKGRGVFRRRGAVWSRFSFPGVAPDAAPLLVRVDAEGAVWFFFSADPPLQGYRLAGKRLDTYTPASGLDIGYLAVFRPDAGGVLLAGKRVARFDGRIFHTLSPSQAAILADTQGIVSDDLGGTWFSTGLGIVRVSTRQLARAFSEPNLKLDYQLFDAQDGLPSIAPLGEAGGLAWRGPDGRLWFLVADGVVWIDPHHLYRNPVPPPVSIQSITADGQLIDTLRDPTLAAGTSDLQIDYTALSLQNPQRVEFRYRLDGVDKGWVDAGGRRQAFYTRLGPGHYRFHVIAANNYGVWNLSGATVDFEIPPTFVQSRWFLLLCAAFAALAIWFAYTMRLRQVTAAVQNRLEERVSERERIARELHDTLLQGFQGLMLRLQAVMERLPPGLAARTDMNAALERADEVLVAGRDHVRQLRAPRGEDLSGTLAEVAESVRGRSDANFQLVVEGAPRPLHPIVADELTAIGREAILNAFQHAKAQRIDVGLTYDRRGLTLRVADDGAGIDDNVLAAGGREGHFGLTGMRERADKVRAKLTISSRPGAGTEIVVTAPAHIAFASADAPGWWARLVGQLYGLVTLRRFEIG